MAEEDNRRFVGLIFEVVSEGDEVGRVARVQAAAYDPTVSTTPVFAFDHVVKEGRTRSGKHPLGPVLRDLRTLLGKYKHGGVYPVLAVSSEWVARDLLDAAFERAGMTRSGVLGQCVPMSVKLMADTHGWPRALKKHAARAGLEPEVPPVCALAALAYHHYHTLETDEWNSCAGVEAPTEPAPTWGGKSASGGAGGATAQAGGTGGTGGTGK